MRHLEQKKVVKRSEFEMLIMAMDELQQENSRLRERVNTLQDDYVRLQQENVLLRTALAQHGIVVQEKTDVSRWRAF